VLADTQALIRLHGLEGSAEGTILARLATHYEVRLRMDEKQAALWVGSSAARWSASRPIC
jgi:hypothetical protein